MHAEKPDAERRGSPQPETDHPKPDEQPTKDSKELGGKPEMRHENFGVRPGRMSQRASAMHGHRLRRGSHSLTTCIFSRRHPCTRKRRLSWRLARLDCWPVRLGAQIRIRMRLYRGVGGGGGGVAYSFSPDGLRGGSGPDREWRSTDRAQTHSGHCLRLLPLSKSMTAEDTPSMASWLRFAGWHCWLRRRVGGQSALTAVLYCTRAGRRWLRSADGVSAL